MTKDVWGAAERKMYLLAIFAGQNYRLQPPGICAWPSPVANFGQQKYRSSGGKFKIQTLTAIFGRKMASNQLMPFLT